MARGRNGLNKNNRKNEIIHISNSEKVKTESLE